MTHRTIGYLLSGVPALSASLLGVCAVPSCSAQTPAAPPAISPPSTSASASIALSLLEQMSDALTLVVGNARVCVVSIEGRVSLRRLPFDETLPPGPPTNGTNSRSTPPKSSSAWESLTPFRALSARQPPNGDDTFPSRDSMITLAIPVAGSGFLVAGGTVVTTAELAEGLQQPVVVFPDGRRVSVSVVRRDAASNVAILVLPDEDAAKGLHWATQERVQPGSFALTLGNQAGFGPSVTLGLISATAIAGRSGQRRYDNLIQFQGVVGGGGGGGPLLNVRGEVTGMIVATPAGIPNWPHWEGKAEGEAAAGRAFAPAPFLGGLSSMGFALPADFVRSRVEILRRAVAALPARGWLGVRPDNRDLKQPGARVEGVYLGGPADRAGMLPGDVLLEVNGQTVRSWPELMEAHGSLPAGRALHVTVQRGSSRHQLTVAITPRPADTAIEQMKVRVQEPAPVSPSPTQKPSTPAPRPERPHTKPLPEKSPPMQRSVQAEQSR